MLSMSKVIKIRKGLNIRLEGQAEKIFYRPDHSETYAVKPTDFPGLTPKLAVQAGDRVLAGSPLFFDKYRPEVLFTSPVSGEVIAIRRGDRRVIQEVVVKPDAKIEYLNFDIIAPESATREAVAELMLKSGTWPCIRQRPYGIVANPTQKPKSIFVSGFDTAPLAPDLDFSVKGEDAAFNAGICALSKLTDGKVYLNLNPDYPASEVFRKCPKVEINYFTGPHPAGNVGVQIHHLDPISKGEVVWTVNPLDVIIIGRLFLKGIYDATKVVALAGSEVLKPKYYKIIGGASINPLIQNNVKQSGCTPRFISGNVLTGTQIAPDGHVGFYDNMVTVIPEGNHHEFMGWATPGLSKFSASRAFPSFLFPDRKYRLDTNLHGGERAFVLSGQYEKVVPMDIYPVHLIKAILAKDVERMEQLGIYEVVEEDLALCEFVCTSKIEVQSILREGIELIIKEMS